MNLRSIVEQAIDFYLMDTKNIASLICQYGADIIKSNTGYYLDDYAYFEMKSKDSDSEYNIDLHHFISLNRN